MFTYIEYNPKVFSGIYVSVRKKGGTKIYVPIFRLSWKHR